MDRYVLGDTDGSRVGGTQRAHMTHVSLTPRPAGIIAMAIVCYRLNRIRTVRNCSRPAGVSGPHALQLTFLHDTLVRLVHAFYPIFKLAVSRTQDEGLCAMP
jgi:hypothetical protein